MTKRHVAMASALALVLVALAVGVFNTRSAPQFTFHYAGKAPYGDGIILNVVISNRTGNLYACWPLRLETRDSAGWKECPVGTYSFWPNDDLRPNEGSDLRCFIKGLPPKSHLRVIFELRKAAQGLDSFASRVQGRLSGSDKGASLNPFDKHVFYYFNPVEIMGDEFSS